MRESLSNLVQLRMTETFGMMPDMMLVGNSAQRATMANFKLEAVLNRGDRLTPLGKKYLSYMVDRHGTTKDAFMITYSVVEEVRRDDTCAIRMTSDGPRLVVIERALADIHVPEIGKEGAGEVGKVIKDLDGLQLHEEDDDDDDFEAAIEAAIMEDRGCCMATMNVLLTSVQRQL